MFGDPGSELPSGSAGAEPRHQYVKGKSTTGRPTLNARDRLAKFLPSRLLFHEEVQEGFSRLAEDVGKPPRNEAEAEAWGQLVDFGCAVVNKGWPDFMVFSNQDDFFLVEVKGPGDTVKPQQRVVLEQLASRGIDVYIRWGAGSDVIYESVGDSSPWSDLLRSKAA
jgi:hypothetical protein